MSSKSSKPAAKKPSKKAPAKKKAAVKKTEMTFDDWMAFGINQGWCGAPVCSTHDGIPMSEYEENAFFEAGEDLCIHIVRMYENEEQAAEVNNNHSPSRWRNHYTQ